MSSDTTTPATPDARPRLSVVIPCRNEAGAIDECLRSVLAQESIPGGVEILVADGRSDDGTREALERWAATDPRIRIIDNPGRIVSTGLNAAIRQARGDVIARLDAHTRYAPDYLRQCLAVLEETGAENVGGPWVPEATTRLGRAIAVAFGSPFASGGGRSHDVGYEGELDTVYLGCWHRSVFDRFGLFDEELVRNQDDEHNFRITRGGGRVWQSPQIRSWYRPRSSLRALFRQYQQYGYWKVRVIQKHGRPASARHLAPVAFALGVLVGAPLCFVHPWFAAAYASAWGVYGVAALIASVAAARSSSWSLLPILPVVFLMYHLGYGLGFARGIWDFLVRRKSPSAAMSTLTRRPSAPTVSAPVQPDG